ncbi:MAG: nitrite/sulfite reductase [Myxococcaceae bacterium]|nr:nitrite/sulfite reductase [Myxococcaceae bacterium]
MSASPLQVAQAPKDRASFGDVAEAQEFVAQLERFEKGEITSDQYRQYRLSRGIYGQRQDGVHMVRVKAPQGVLTGAQLRVLADSCEKWSRGYGHVTTRQNFQFHAVKPEHVAPFMEALANAGLTTREACSHTVRNVAGCPYAGVCGGAPFDVTPYGELVTRHFLRGAWGSGLPRKFKISISGCPDDCAQGAMNDIGIIARMENGRRGFRILIGGGTATYTTSGNVLHEFLPEAELLEACEAVVRVFHAEGERKNLHKARMKWAIKRLGFDAFRQKYLEQREAVRAEGGRPLPTLPPPEAPPAVTAAPLTAPSSPATLLWKQTSVKPQSQAGYSSVNVWLRLGDLSAPQMRAIADLVETRGDGTIRTTQSQNFVIRWVRDADLAGVHGILEQLGLASPHADRISDVVTCPGAETCRIAVTASRGVAQLVGEHLRAKGTDTTAVGSADIRVSGCPNGCGQNHIAAIGLQGAVRRLGSRLVPQYHVTIGGGIDGQGASFGRLVGKVPARRVPEAIDRLIAHFEKHKQAQETPRDYFKRLSADEAKGVLGELLDLTEANAQPDDFIDLGSTTAFEVVAMDGECAQ